MGATEAFDTFNRSLPPDVQATLEKFIRAEREDLLAARSEDERLRLVQSYVEEVRKHVHPVRQ